MVLTVGGAAVSPTNRRISYILSVQIVIPPSSTRYHARAAGVAPCHVMLEFIRSPCGCVCDGAVPKLQNLQFFKVV